MNHDMLHRKSQPKVLRYRMLEKRKQIETMKIKDRKQFIEILDTMEEMFAYLRTVRDEEEWKQYIEQCIETLKTLHEHLTKASESFNDKSLSKLLELCSELLGCPEDEQKKLLKKAVRLAEEIKLDIKNGIPIRYQAVFLPYKASMWTALESIWMEADADPECDAVVMPIPYYELSGSGRKKKLCYEGELFPDYVPITDYKSYRVEDNYPEMIFIHNPYDETNTATRVPEHFYSSYLREYTDCLVFSPYFTYGEYTRGETDSWFLLAGMKNADKIIVQSEKVKRKFVQTYGYPSNKILAAGSPKIDAVVNRLSRPMDMPDEWKDKLEGKDKIFLLNTHMMYFIRSANAAEEEYDGFDYGIDYHRKILDVFQRYTNCGLIWRPHPLMKVAMTEDYARSPRYTAGIDFIREFEETLEKSSNCVIDRNGDYHASFYHSDALIATASSLNQEYMATGKPILNMDSCPTDESAQRAFIDFRDMYYASPPESMTFEQFVDMVLAGEDPRKESRSKAIQSAFANLRGNAGEKAYKEICGELK